MDTDSTPTNPPAPGSPRWAGGCGIAVAVLTALVVLGSVALGEFEKGLTGYGHLEGTSGSDAEPLRPGATARYDDGLTITVSAPHREPDNTYGFTVTYDNGTDEELRPGGTPPDTGVGVSGFAPIVVRGGKPRSPDIPGWGVTVLDRAGTESALTPPLGKDRKRTVPVRIKPDKEGGFVTVKVTPQSAGYRDAAYWQFTLN
ncbi:hypothetical protein AB0D10_26135 [Kitasatospora sp. NPDC048545]|uniref:hypothetical protein n=1 Tax=Kitasatospora sp. NPDC048545 TaxID=3157208 RepID=UPI0033CFA983